MKYTPDKTLNAFMTKKNKITVKRYSVDVCMMWGIYLSRPVLSMQKENIGNISRVTGKSESAIKEYVRLKRKADCNEKKITKFIEALWRTIFYSVFVVVGMRTLLFPDVASWVLDGRELCIGWPEEHVASEAVLQYYYIELGAYFHQLLWTEVSRSDSVEMIAHHLITIALLVLSHAANFNRYGSMLLILHDISDVFLESAKCFNYVSQVPRWKHFHIACDVLFGGFVITFFVCRLVLFPKVFLVNSFAYCVHEYFGFHFYFAPLILSLLFLLFCLHIFWFYLTIKMIFRLLSPEGITKDERSDDEDDSDDELSGDDNSGAKKQTPIARKKTKKDN